MVDYNASFKKPFLEIKNLIIGILLSIVPIVNWFAVGYMLECSGLTRRKVPLNKSPAWTGWGDLFVKGFFSAVIAIVYVLPALIVFLIGLFSAFYVVLKEVFSAQVGVGTTASDVVMQNWDKILPIIVSFLPVVIITVALLLLAFYLTPMATLNYIYNNRLGKGFAVSEVCKKAFTGSYFVAWFLAVIISIVASIVLMWIPFIGSPAASFIGGVITYTILGQVFMELNKNASLRKV